MITFLSNNMITIEFEMIQFPFDVSHNNSIQTIVGSIVGVRFPIYVQYLNLLRASATVPFPKFSNNHLVTYV